MTDTKLSFTKIYHTYTHGQTARSPISYEYIRTENGWVGSYSVLDQKGGYTGNSACRINSAVEEAFGIAVGPLKRE